MDLAVKVGKERVVDLPETTLLAGRLDPREMGELRVNRSADDSGVDLLELLHVIASGIRFCPGRVTTENVLEGNDFGRADESEVAIYRVSWVGAMSGRARTEDRSKEQPTCLVNY